MPDKNDDKRYLNVKYEDRRQKTVDGQERSERSAEVTLRANDRKQNPRRSEDGKKEDSASRKATGQRGYDSTHKIPAEAGASPTQRENYTPFNRMMNRGTIREHEKQTQAALNRGEDVHLKNTSMHRVKSGQEEKVPMAIRSERENLTTGKKDKVYFGNFSSNASRVEQPQNPTSAQRKQANAKDRALYKENQERPRDVAGEFRWRNDSKEKMRSRVVVDNTKAASQENSPSKKSGQDSKDKGGR